MVQVTQYDDDGNVIGTVMRDIQFVVIACANQAPDPATGPSPTFHGTATQVGPYNIELCETDNFCFDFTILDSDVTDTLTLLSNIATVLPGATFTYGQVRTRSPAPSAGRPRRERRASTPSSSR